MNNQPWLLTAVPVGALAAHQLSCPGTTARLHMRHLTPLQRIARRDPHCLAADAIDVRRRMPALVASDTHPLRPQQRQLLRHAMTVGDQLHERIAVQHQRSANAFQHALGQPRGISLLSLHRQPTNCRGHQPHRPQANGIGPIDLAQLRLIPPRKSLSMRTHQPRRRRIGANRRVRRALAPEPI